LLTLSMGGVFVCRSYRQRCGLSVILDLAKYPGS
jgi:hypothetical protein